MTDADGGPAHPVFAALYDPVTSVLEATSLRPHREYLARDLSGTVLDLGAGTGASFPYFAAAGGDATFHAVEPDPHMRRRAERRAAELGFDVEVRAAGAEDLPYPDDSFDAVVAAIVFCTIPDVDAALSAVARGLQPGGAFRVLEHVHADGWRGRLQDLATPAWRLVAGGCHLNRRTGSEFAAHEAFDVVELERIDVGVTPVWPFVRGRLRRRSDA
jgi:ubiquinone/menaquinone biosynthesis C-methylase UbiE